MNKLQGGAGKRAPGPLRGLLAALVCWASMGGASSAQEAPRQQPKEDDPISAEIELNRGIVDFEQGRYGKALERLGGADAGGAGAAYYRGLSNLALLRAKEALREFEAVRKRPGAPAQVDLDLGVAQLSAGDPAKAEATLTRYVQAQPDDPYGHYFLGVAQFRQRRYPEAMARFQRASTDATLAPYLDLYQGLDSYARGDAQYRQHLNQFRSAVDTGPSALVAQRLASSPVPGQGPAAPSQASAPPPGWGRPVDKDAGADRRWNFAVLNGYEYDTNVSLAPSIVTQGLGVGTNMADSRWAVATFGDFRLVQREDWVLGLIGSTYDTWQFQLDQFNIQDYMGGTYSNVALGKDWILGMRYEFHETLLGGDQFATDHRLTPNLTYREGEFGHTTAFYEYEALDIQGFALIPAQIRSGNINAVGVTQAFYLMGGAGRFFLAYRYEGANTQGSDFDRRTNMIDARLEIPLPGKIVLNADVRQFWDDYQNPDSLDFFGRLRSDRRVETHVGFQKFFTAHTSLRIDYIYTMNDSSVENLFGASFYTYDRHVLSTMFIYDF